jgi:hypothetical protein
MTGTCRQVLERLGQPFGPELSAHVQRCEVCKPVVESYELLGNLPDAKLVPLPSRLHSSVASELSQHPTLPTWRRPAVLLMALNVVVALAATLALAGGRFDVVHLNPSALMLSILFVGLLVIGPWIALVPRHRGARAVLLGLCLALAALLIAEGSGIGTGAGFIRGGIGCLVAELAISLLPLAIGIWILTQSAFHPVRTAVVGLSAASAGLFALHTHCENGLALHLLTFHLLPWLAVTGLAIWIRAHLPSRSFAP